MTRRVAMWSGPRNISTALMRSFENRPDTCVVDEPFYAAYLHATGITHPMQQEIMAAQPNSPEQVVSALGKHTQNTPYQYEKQMTHHFLETFPHDWLSDVTHCFLIRDPSAMIASYAKAMDKVSLDAIGLPQQVRIFDYVCELTGTAPPVIDSRDILVDPENMLQHLCTALDMPFFKSMLKWPAGTRKSDGVWAPHWYTSVIKSTGFTPPEDKAYKLDPALMKLAEDAQTYYDKMSRHKLRP